MPTLVKEPAGSWQLLWLKYFNPFGTVTGVAERQKFLYWRTFSQGDTDIEFLLRATGVHP